MHLAPAFFITLPPVFYILLVIALGLFLGDIPFPGGFKLGVAGILFSGLILGAFLPGQKIPAVLLEMGLILFVYGVGLQTGPGFFRSFRKDGLKLNLAVLVSLLTAFFICSVLVLVLGQSSLTIAGLFCGALTNTPALGAATETLANTSTSEDDVNSVVVGYAIAYPFAIMGVLLIIQFGAWLSRRGRNPALVDRRLQARTVEIATLQDGRAWTVQALETAFEVRVTRLRLG